MFKSACTLAFYYEFALHPQKSQLLVCHCGHVSVVAELCWCLLPVSIFGLDLGLKGIV